MKKALIAMSGGVDSSVAALIMKNRGFECIGCTMKLYEKVEDEEEFNEGDKTCCSLSDVEDARSVAHKLGMPYYVFNYKDEFKEKVIDKFVCSYLCGKTPNPCIDCNQYLKFGALMQRARELGCDKVVTGHYARITFEDGLYHLRRGLDPSKDQSYVLYGMTQEILSHTEFPLGDMNKDKARELALENGLVNAHKSDSQDICFVPDGDYAKVIEHYSGKKSVPGNFVKSDGTVMGQHKGIVNYTIGQHKGLGIYYHEKMYVCKIDVDKNEVVLGSYEDLFVEEMLVENFNWTSGSVPREPVKCNVMTRYRGKEIPATVIPTGETTCKVVFDGKQKSVTPGQAAVLYNNDEVIGGGTIVGAI